VSKAPASPTYTIFVDGRTQRGTARELLERIRADAARRSEEIAKMDADQYAAVLVKDAAYFLPEDFLSLLSAQTYESQYDRALRYLAEMDASGVRILTKDSTRN